MESKDKKKDEPKDKVAKKTKVRFPKKSLVKSIVLLVIIFFLLKIYWPKITGTYKQDITTISKSSLEKIIEISDLSTLDYTYNAVTDVKDENEKVKYHVSYEGVVSSGIDFSKIDFKVDEEEKLIHIKLPQAQIQDVRIDTGSMDYIFEKKRFETENVAQEAYTEAIKDLRLRARRDKNLIKMANENAVDTVTALIEPWLNEVDGSYRMEVEVDEN